MATKDKTTTEKSKKINDQLSKEFTDIVSTAATWCAEHAVPITIMPDDVFRLANGADRISEAILAAGGPDKVPKAVLMYDQMLRDVATLLLAHGIKRVAFYFLGAAAH